MEFNIRAREKKAQEDREYGLKREQFVEEALRYRHRAFGQYQRIWRGQKTFSDVLQKVVKQFIADIRPELMANQTYFDTRVLFDMEYPEDTGYEILFHRAFLEVQDKRSVDIAYSLGGDIRKEPVMPGSRLYINAVIKKATNYVSPMSLVKQQISRAFLNIFINKGADQLKNDVYTGLAAKVTNNASLLRAVEMATAFGARQELNSMYQRLLVDNEKLDEFVTLMDTYRTEYIQKWMQRVFLAKPELADLGGSYQTWGLEDIAQIFARYLLLHLPQRKWADLYSLDTTYAGAPRIDVMRYREAILAHNRYTIIFRPNEMTVAGPLPELQIRSQRSDVYTSTDIEELEFNSWEGDFLMNVGSQGRYQAVDPRSTLTNALYKSADGYEQGYQAHFGAVQPGKRFFGTKMQRDGIELVPEFCILPDAHQLFRLMASLDNIKPTIIDLRQPDGKVLKVLHLPDTSGRFTIVPRYTSLHNIVPKIDSATVDGMISETLYAKLSPFFKNAFMSREIATYGEEEGTITQILGGGGLGGLK